MAVQNQTPYTEYTANGSTTSFALGFDCESQNHLIVLINDSEPEYGAWYLNDNTVVFNTAPKNNQKVSFKRETPLKRETDFQSYDNSFRPKPVNKDFDRIWWKLQELGVADWLLRQYIDRKNDELKNYLLEETGKQGVAIDQLDDYYNYLMERLAQIAVDKGWDASFVVDGDKNQHQINNETKESLTNLSDNFKNNSKEIINIENEITDLKESGKFITVRHYRQNGFIYDVITGIQPHQLELKSNQVSSDSPVMTRLTAKQASEKFNRPIVINASAFRNADDTSGWNNDLLVPNGIHIQDGKVITGWDYGTNILRNQAVCLMGTGELKRFYRDTSAQQMVEQGAVLGQSWGAWLVYDGVVPDDFATAVINDAGKSAKTVIFQMPDNSIGFLLIEGVTGSYGATSAEAGQICLGLGVKCAYSLDGGGSSQCWWGDSYAMPSSDATTRTLASYLTVNVTSVLSYDSGFVPVAHNSSIFGNAVSDSTKPPLFLKQKGEEVTLYLNINSNALPPSAITAITDGTSVPVRYRSNSPIYARALMIGGGGNLFRCYQGGGSFLGLFNAEPFDSTKIPTSLVGKLSWYQKHI